MDAELIVILVAVGLSILSGINKSKKKKTRQEQSHQPEPGNDDDPWATIRKYIEEARSEEDYGTEESESPVPVTAVPAKPARQRIQAAPQTEEENPYTSSLNEYAKKKSAEAALRKADAKKGRVKASPLQDRQEPQAQENLMEDFDLRKAVLYSEILKPRFEEF